MKVKYKENVYKFILTASSTPLGTQYDQISSFREC